MAEEDFFSFDEALSELRLKEEELKRLVSEGEIRAFREGDTMRLRRGDVEALRDELSGDIVDVGSGDEELVFEDEDALGDKAGMATEEISDVDTIIEEEDVEDVGEIDLDDEEEIVTAQPVRRAAPRGAAAAAADEEETEGMGLRAAMIVTTLFAVAALPVVFAVASGHMTSLAEPFAGMFAK
ncbi:MAG: hypothetical protein QF410_08385 [Planctomycetota bacterium]|nr:hypothetical protein [Planctomycetota bacterium]MDP6764171.1 hypothetical protein [Planctomycetota bacterium]